MSQSSRFEFSLDCQDIKPKFGPIEEVCNKDVAYVLCKHLADNFVLLTKVNNFRHNLVGKNYHQFHCLLRKHEIIILAATELISKEIRNMSVRVPALPELVNLTRIAPIPREKWPSEKAMLGLLLEDLEIHLQNSYKDVRKVKKMGDLATYDLLRELLKLHKCLAHDVRSHLDRAGGARSGKKSGYGISGYGKEGRFGMEEGRGWGREEEERRGWGKEEERRGWGKEEERRRYGKEEGRGWGKEEESRRYGEEESRGWGGGREEGRYGKEESRYGGGREESGRGWGSTEISGRKKW